MSFVNSTPDTIVQANVSGSAPLYQDSPPIDFDAIVSAFQGSAVSDAAEMPPTGSLIALHRGGISLKTAVPVLPYDQRFVKPKNPESPDQGRGKAPACFKNGGWHTINDWQRGGIASDVLVASEEAGCNGGVILGAPSEITSPDDKGDLYFFDIDLSILLM